MSDRIQFNRRELEILERRKKVRRVRIRDFVANATVNQARKSQNMSTRKRPPRYINNITLTLERGDGECIDLGNVPDTASVLAMSQFVVRLNEAIHKCGSYDHRYRMDWRPQELEFHVTDEE